MGVLGLVLSKVHILGVMRQLCQRYAGQNEGVWSRFPWLFPKRFCSDYIEASVQLAHEYVKLGKTRKARAIYGHVLNAVEDGQISDEVKTAFFLRYAHLLAISDDLARR